MNYKVLVVNPGSTSTKIGVFEDEEKIFNKNLFHPKEEISRFEKIVDQYEFREKVILNALKEENIDLQEISAVVGRGGLLRPIPGGTYRVNEAMIHDLRIGLQGEHASNLGGILAYEIAKPYGIPAFIVDPVVVDEMEPIAKLSGIPEIQRRSIFHALNHKAVARLAAKKLGKRYNEVNLIVVHLGGGISVGVHSKGRVIDVNNALNGDGPFAPERAGGLPVWDAMKLALSGKFTERQLKKKLAGGGGIVSYLGTNDMKEVGKMIKQGDEKANLVFQAMAYQTAKEIGADATVLKGRVDAIVLTGGLAHSEMFVGWIKERVSFIAPVLVYPGEDEMRALAFGALRVLKGEEKAMEY